MVESKTTKFDIERMIEAFENIEPSDTSSDDLSPSSTTNNSDNESTLWLPNTRQFLGAMKEVMKLFELFGTAFLFVRRDIQSKVTILEGLLQENGRQWSSLKEGVDMEVREGIVEDKEVRSGTRELYRLMWVNKFILSIMTEMDMAFKKDEGILKKGVGGKEKKGFWKSGNLSTGSGGEGITMRVCMGNAYEIALAEHHSWSVRKTVHAALYFLPSSKEAFLERMGVVRGKRYEYLERLQKCLRPVNEEMYRYYEKNNLLQRAL